MNPRNIVQSLLAWFARNARDLPWRRTRDPYAIWVSEIMLQQTQVKTVLPYWERWMQALPNLGALARARPERLHKLWEGLGYYTRVRNLQRAAQVIGERYGGQIPKNFDDLLALPGIGRYTAGAICSIAFNQPKPILDGNVIRVLARIYGIAGDPRGPGTNARLWQIAEELVRQAAKAEERSESSPHSTGAGRRKSSGAGPGACSCLNQSLMELGALICTPREPQCGVCPIAKHCVAYREDRILELPQIGRRIRATPRRFVAFVAEKRGRLLVRQRPAGVVNAHLWEFPNLELSPADSDLERAAHRVLKVRPRRLELLCTIKHSITRYRITLEAYRVGSDDGARISAGDGRWLDRMRLGLLAFASAHGRVLRRLELLDVLGGQGKSETRDPKPEGRPRSEARRRRADILVRSNDRTDQGSP
jgi:A/G-specific adenine glycosylase